MSGGLLSGAARPWVWLAIALQVLVLLWMAGEREWIVQTGERLWLRTAPVDPRDPFRGDYVQLNYEISRIGRRQLGFDPQQRTPPKGTRLFAELEVAPDGVARLRRVAEAPPETGPFLRGRVVSEWFSGPWGGLEVKYGIEQFFVEQGRGREIEARQGVRQGVQVPMEVELAVNGRGTGVIVGYRWSPLGIGLRNLRRQEGPAGPPAPDAPGEIPLFELTLQNASVAPLALLLLPEDCSFALESVAWSPQELAPARPECEGVEPAAGQLLTLAPGASWQRRFDFTETRWHVVTEGGRQPIDALPWDHRFRLVYRPPAARFVASPETLPPWQGELSSRAFHGQGQID
jgi:uncharacterized membrane-anchored protein